MNLKAITSTLVVTIVTAIVSILTIVVTARVIGPLPISLTQTIAEKQGTFDVQGESEMSVIPDTAEITLGIVARNASVAGAQQQANTTITAIQTALTELGIEKKDIKTENYNVNPEYDFQSGSQRILGYSVNTNLRINVQDFEKLNQIIDRATAAGANQVGGIQFILSPEKEQEVKKQARQEAIDQAKKSAAELSSLAGMKLGKIVNVIETPQQQMFPMFGRADLANVNKEAAQGGAPTDIQPGSTKYTYTVTLSYETL